MISFLNVRDGSSDCSGITRTVGNEETVVIFVGKVVVPRHNFNGNVAHFDELSDNVVLHTAVYGDDLKLAMAVSLDFLGRNFLHQVAGKGAFEIDILVENNFTKHNTAATELASQGTSIDSAESGDIFALEPVAQRSFSLPVRVVLRVVRDEQTRNICRRSGLRKKKVWILWI